MVLSGVGEGKSEPDGVRSKFSGMELRGSLWLVHIPSAFIGRGSCPKGRGLAGWKERLWGRSQESCLMGWVWFS